MCDEVVMTIGLVSLIQAACVPFGFCTAPVIQILQTSPCSSSIHQEMMWESPQKQGIYLKFHQSCIKCGVSHSRVSWSLRENFRVVIMSWLIKALDTAEVSSIWSTQFCGQSLVNHLRASSWYVNKPLTTLGCWEYSTEIVSVFLFIPNHTLSAHTLTHLLGWNINIPSRTLNHTTVGGCHGTLIFPTVPWLWTLANHPTSPVCLSAALWS